MKIMVDQKLVKKLLASGMKAYTIGKQYGVPLSVTEDIAKGKSRSFYYKKVAIDKAGICECCGFRVIHPGFRKLCITCYGQNTEDAIMDSPQIINL